MKNETQRSKEERRIKGVNLTGIIVVLERIIRMRVYLNNYNNYHSQLVRLEIEVY